MKKYLLPLILILFLTFTLIGYCVSYTSQYPPEQSGTYVKATTYVNINYYPHFTTDPTKPLIGTMVGNSWCADSATNQRFHIRLLSAKIIRRIYYENGHHEGGGTNRGVQNFTFWGSNTLGSFTDLVYGNNEGWTELTVSQNTFDEHVALDQADPKFITVTNSTAYKYYAFKFADNYGDASNINVRRIVLQIEYTGNTYWVEVAPKLGDETIIYSLAVYNDKLYGGTYPNGKLYEWNGTNAWVEVAPKLGDETYILSLAVYNNKLYGGTTPNGKLYEWNDVNAWVEVAPKLGDETYILSLAVYNNKLYGGTFKGRLHEWNGSDAWVEVAPTLGANSRIESLAVYNNKLYGVAGYHGGLYEWNDVNAWVEVAPNLEDYNWVNTLAVYNNKLYGGTSFKGGKLYEWNDVNAWVEVAPKLGDETWILSLAVYNDKLYGGTIYGRLHEWNDVNAWVEVAPKLSETWIYSLAVYNDKLYGGTGANGKLYEWPSIAINIIWFGTDF